MKLILRTLYHNSRDLRSGVSKIDALASDSKKAATEQRKSFDHQRVLISSLNRQINKLDAMLVGEDNSGGTPGNTNSPVVDPDRTASITKLQANNRGHAPGKIPIAHLLEGLNLNDKSPSGGAVLLEKLFAERSTRKVRVHTEGPVPEQTGSYENVTRLEALSRQFHDEVQAVTTEANLEDRRISNG